ncbi:hypothetical protein ACKFKF_21680 [Phormidesmis sp. 146-12]
MKLRAKRSKFRVQSVTLRAKRSEFRVQSTIVPTPSAIVLISNANPEFKARSLYSYFQTR